MSRFIKPDYRSLNAYVPGEQPRDMQYIKLNTNESPYPPAPTVQEAVGPEEVSLLRLYSDPTCRRLKEKLAALYDLKAENIFLGNGSDDLLNFAFMAFGYRGAVFPDITYGFYKVFSELHGIFYEEIPLKPDYSLCYKDYCGQNRLVVFANPNAPTGMSIPVSQIEEILRTNPDSVVVVDEAYVDFGGDSCCRLLKKYGNLLIARTFSKSRCMAGARLGYALGAPGLIEDLEKLKFSTNPYSINRLTLLLGESTVDAEPYYRKCCSEIMRTREKTRQALEQMGFSVLPSETNFLFASHPDQDGERLYQKLKARGILVRHFSQERISHFIRITVGTEEQMDCFLKTIRSILQGGAQ